MGIEARKALGIKESAPFDPWAYAAHVNVLVLNFDELRLTSEAKKRLLITDPESWSGMTLREGKTTGVVINPSHASVRQVSTLTHELSHLVLKHVPSQVNVSSTGMLLLSDYSDDDEAEADWLAGAMLAPRDVLFEKRQKGRTVAQIAVDLGISGQLCEWRLRMTGVELQIKRASGGR